MSRLPKKPRKRSHHKGRYGFNTIKKLLMACEIFDVYDAPLTNGAFRTLYQTRPTN